MNEIYLNIINKNKTKVEKKNIGSLRNVQGTCDLIISWHTNGKIMERAGSNKQ